MQGFLQHRMHSAIRLAEATRPKLAEVLTGCPYGPIRPPFMFSQYLLFKIQVCLGTGSIKGALCQYFFY
jgi:hypothetical protein